MSGLARRTPAAIAYGAILIVPLVLGPRWFAIAVGALGALAYIELVRLFGRRSTGPDMIGVALIVVFTIPRIFVGRDVLTDLFILTAGGVAAVVGVSVKAALVSRPALTIAGAVYLGWVFGYLSDLAWAGSSYTAGALPDALPIWLLVALVATWVSDITAYLVGSAVGRRRLAPRISPGKTWEGTTAGFFGAAVTVVALGAVAGMPAVATGILAVAIGPAALFGDLFQSSLKRRAGAKDSGTLLPGHGGVFDRIDSLVTVAPVVAIALFVAGTLG